jgi:SAM-dependent methyltransferase
MIDEAVQRYYQLGMERARLADRDGTLELVRTQELLLRHLPPPPAGVLDLGGGPGVYASWLARVGYRVRLIDPMPLHVEQARTAARSQPDHPFEAFTGEARRLDEPDASWDAVLLMGPLYHLTERAERLAALAETGRVVRPGGLVAAVGISRFASLHDAMRRGLLDDPEMAAMVERDLRDGQHRNPSLDRNPGWFTTAFFHHPDELAAEVWDAGLELEGLLAIEGPGWLFEERWADPAQRASILRAVRAVEREPSLLGQSGHLLAVARRAG